MVDFIEINSEDKCLIIAPHPDDESIGCGGFILQYPQNTDVVILTDGCKGGYGTEEEIVKQRLQELTDAMRFAKVRHWQNMMIPDRKVHKNLTKIKDLKLHEYDYVFVPNGKEFHIDHKPILKYVQKCLFFFPKTKIIAYEVWSPIPNPNLYLNISDLKDKKAALISYYKSQLQYNDYTTKTLALNKYRGLLSFCDYAEAYYQYDNWLFTFKKKNNRVYLKILGIKFSSRQLFRWLKK